MQKNKILISGYYGFDNAGDEAVLAAIVAGLRQAIPQAQLVVLSANEPATAATLGVATVDRRDKKKIAAQLADCAVFISGGGSLLQDKTSVRSVVYYAGLIMLAAKQGVPIVVLAQGLGPLDKWISRRICAVALKKAQRLIWRDADSLALAASLGVPKEKMEVTCDPVLGWQPPTNDEQTAQTTAAPRRAVFCLREWGKLNCAALAGGADELVKQGYNVQFAPFHGNDDAALATKVAALMQQPSEILPPQTPTAAWQTIGRADLVLGMRLHALIMAAAQGRPAVAISYDPKIDSFAALAGLQVIAKAENIQEQHLVTAGLSGGSVTSPEQRLIWQQACARNYQAIADIFTGRNLNV